MRESESERAVSPLGLAAGLLTGFFHRQTTAGATARAEQTDGSESLTFEAFGRSRCSNA